VRRKGKAYAGHDVRMIPGVNSSSCSVRVRKDQSASEIGEARVLRETGYTRIEIVELVMPVDVPRFPVVADTEVQCQLSRNAPVILHLHRAVKIFQLRAGRVGDGTRASEAEKEGGVRVPTRGDHVVGTGLLLGKRK
jgi:hypothetical protein